MPLAFVALAGAAQAFSLILPILLPGVVLIAALKRGWWRMLDVAVDGGALLGGRPLLGRTKTWRGVAIYTLGGAATGLLLAFFAMTGTASGVFGGTPAPAMGAAVGFGAGVAYCLGEFVNSFVKRRLGLESSGVAPGGWGIVQRAVDLCDGIVAAALLYLVLGVPPLIVLIATVLGVGIHATTDAIMRALRLKRSR